MKNNRALETLKSSLMFWSRLGFSHDPALLDENGQPHLFFDNFDVPAKYHNDFVNAGVKVHTSILFSGWVGGDKQYDYTLTDKTLDALFKSSPDICYIPRIKLNVPISWAAANPEELFVYHEGPREKEEIRALVGTLKHDLLGYESPNGYFMGKDSRPNVNGLISNQSFTSKKWLVDASKALANLIEHIQQGPYADRIIGYHVAYGACGENMLWGRDSNRYGDYGIACHKAFFEWGMDKYKSLQCLRKNWMQPNLTADNLILPSPDQRQNCCDSLEDFFRVAPEYKICIDYDIFMSEVNCTAMEVFGKVVKDKTDNKALVGCFYGYFLEIFNAAYTGHLALDRALASPYLDFFAAPTSYQRRELGEPGGEIAPAQSINRHKLWIDEIDIRTHLSEEAYKRAKDFTETKTLLWREFSKNLSHGSHLWWMDLGGGWFDSDNIMKEIAKIRETYETLKSIPARSISEVLLVVDDTSFCYQTADRSWHKLFMINFVREANLTGTPVDMYRLSDLQDMDLSQYKIIFFLNTFKIDSEIWSQIKSGISSFTSLVWFHAAGILSPDFDLDNIRKTTGFSVTPQTADNSTITMRSSSPLGKCSLIYKQDHPLALPLLKLKDVQEEQIWGQYEDGSIAAAATKGEDNHWNIYFALPLLKAKHLRKLYALAGCHFYAPLDCTVYGDNRFISVFSRSNCTGKINLKKSSEMIDVISGESWNDDKIPIKLTPKDAVFLTSDLGLK